ncbi:unnamed protein product [Parnassius apollo]|uniref:(apollo) hypothetical protein n=1 Tax=Parnassius apollo TaxID=110799 RepID=A0A8S3Y9X5_PARAO|nr:unnamed protein product [Parnassius apollo]
MLFAGIYVIIIVTSTAALPPSRYTSENNDKDPKEAFNEIPCLSVGGICMNTSDCPEGKRSQYSGLCPVQQRMSVECCHSLPKSEKRCRHRGGMCMANDSSCPDYLTYKGAKDFYSKKSQAIICC